MVSRDGAVAILTGLKEGCARHVTPWMYGPASRRIDTCAAEFAALTPYMYSTYESPLIPKWAAEKPPAKAIRRTPEDHHLAAGPTASARASSSTIACCHAAYSLSERGYETIMV